MDKVVGSMENAYNEFINSVTALLEARQNNGGEGSVNAALESITLKYELFKAACDNAEVYVNSAKQSIACKSGVDLASYERSVQGLPVDDCSDEGGVVFEDDNIVRDEEVQLVKEFDDADTDVAAVHAKGSDEAEGPGDDKDNVVEKDDAAAAAKAGGDDQA